MEGIRQSEKKNRSRICYFRGKVVLYWYIDNIFAIIMFMAIAY